ncbi:Hypothetical predicted protein [Marmota monax]|uniref:Uncharacterized protein n=1 Tax=Marmota monax TaxID=9995 RepID=A0A5E4CGN0_MARMO|nr:hypothetical protein GHT09_003203 [Marmota monax]VTJ80062.1 Hypothetical predicted protein [Marmota monax]
MLKIWYEDIPAEFAQRGRDRHKSESVASKAGAKERREDGEAQEVRLWCTPEG